MYLNFLLPLMVAFVFVASGCSTPQASKTWPKKQPLGSELRSFEPAGLPSMQSEADQALSEEPKGVITLRDSLALALLKNPRLRAFAWEIRAREAHVLQAGLLPNPEVSIEIENVEGSGAFKGTDVAETTLQLGQLIELGGKRLKRVKVANLERSLAGWDYETVRIVTLTEVTKTFIDVLAAQERLKLAKELVNLAERAFSAASERVSAGKAPPIDETKAKVELSVNRIELGKAEKNLVSARKHLATFWGSVKPAFKMAEGELGLIKTIPSSNQLKNMISQNPDIARWNSELDRFRAAVDLERAGRVPDLTVAGGVRRFSETDDSAIVLGVSMPLMIFNRNQGAYQEARFNLAKALEQQKAEELLVVAKLADGYRDLSTAYAEAIALKSDVIPGAKEAFETAREGYLQGKFGYLEVLDAQRVLFETKEKYIDSLAAYHKASANVERLIGASLDAVSSNDTSDGR
ncbi:Heavy metal RND efflux outer membrane protein, CzcC family [hydrothermal vent metagenome]|uniref:Heavy metal RND efflux outer membrane protein, CzcC family n=1 Tax=hydrothermal vent metagenome TaxID=652676 RepID=A0A3B1CIM9_9ZZZZ